jgi:hypothetical protein
VDLLGVGRPALGIADDPAHGVAGGDRAGAGQLLALLQGDVGHLSGRGVDLVERALGERKHLHGIHVAAAARLHPGRGIGDIDTLARIARLGRRAGAWHRLELARQRQGLGYFHHLDSFGGIVLQNGGHGRLLVVIADLWRLERRAGGERG